VTLRSRKRHDWADALLVAEYGFNGAVTLRSRKPSTSWVCADTRRGFNGAVTLRSRKRQGGQGPEGQGEQLQWGRDLAVTET